MQNILFVDDEENILAAFQRQLRGRFAVYTAISGQQGLDLIMTEGPFAAIIADLRMPAMDGVEFLAKAKDYSPDSVRVMLTGQADLITAVKAINEGNIFRFLAKPCSSDTLLKVLTSAIEQYQLVTSERVLLEKTLKQSVLLLMDMLSISNPVAFNQTLHLRKIVNRLVSNLNLPDGWLYTLAANLSQIGCISLPSSVLEKAQTGLELTTLEANLFASHPIIGARLLQNIPRIEDVSCIVRDQERDFATYQEGQPVKKRVALGAQILKVALGYDRIILSGVPHRMAVLTLAGKASEYNPEIVHALGDEQIVSEDWRVMMIHAEGLEVGMIADDDVFTHSGKRLLAKNQELTEPVFERVQILVKSGLPVVEPFRVLVPQAEAIP